MQQFDEMVHGRLDEGMPFLEPTPAKRGGWSLYGGRIHAKVPATATYRPDCDDPNPIPYEVTMTLDISEGRLVCTELTARMVPGGKPVTSELLRRIPVGEFVAAAAALGGIFQFSRKMGNAWTIGGYEAPPKDFAVNGMTDEALEHIAEFYAFCQSTGQKPTGELNRQYGIPRPTTSKWVNAARKRGILSDEHRKLSEDFIGDPVERLIQKAQE